MALIMSITVSPATLTAVRASISTPVRSVVRTVARIAGIQAAKRTPDLIPLCHPLFISGVDVTAEVTDDGWTTPPGRAQLMPVRWVGPDRVARATARGSGSHLVARLALAEGLAVIPAEVSQVTAGDRVTVLRVSP